MSALINHNINDMMKMKMMIKMEVVAAALGIATTVSAQVSGSADRATQIQWSQQFAQVGDLSDAFIRQGSLWTDGNFVYQLGTDGKTVALTNISSLSTEGHPRDKELVRKNSKLMVKGKKDVMTREKIGGWDLLVIRDKNQKTLDTYVRWNDGQSDLSALERDLHIIYDGVYTLYSIDQGEATYPNKLAALGSTLLFGPNLFGDQVDSSDDPGDYRINGNSIFFGGNRIKVVRQPSLNVQKRAGKDVYFIDDREVSKKEFEQMREVLSQRGRGGHASLPGPTQWDVSLREQGLTVVAHLNEGVAYHPFCGSYFTLTKLDDGYPELDGFYSFASVVPLTRGMLERFPKNALRLMQWEMYARHGLPILDPAYQNYFNGRPWYKPTGSHTLDMTDLEVINFRLIQTVEFEKK